MKFLALALLLLVAAGLAWVRLAPSDPARWHVDPLAAGEPGEAGVLLTPDGPESAPVYPVPPDVLMAAFDRVAAARPRTRRLAGAPEDGHVTYVTRTKWVGFPDYVSVRALPAEGGATLAIYSRLRFGGSDWGVNRARTAAWLQALEAALQ